MTAPTLSQIQVQPYLFFDGRCEEALEFYRRAIGAEVISMMRFKDSPDPNSCAPGQGDKIMHADVRIGSTVVMASDGRCQGVMKFDGFGLALSARDVAEAQRLFSALSDGGQVQMPLGQTFFSPAFGMVNDRFGIVWMVIVPMPRP